MTYVECFCCEKDYKRRVCILKKMLVSYTIKSLYAEDIDVMLEKCCNQYFEFWNAGDSMLISVVVQKLTKRYFELNSFKDTVSDYNNGLKLLNIAALISQSFDFKSEALIYMHIIDNPKTDKKLKLKTIEIVLHYGEHQFEMSRDKLSEYQKMYYDITGKVFLDESCDDFVDFDAMKSVIYNKEETIDEQY